MRKFAKDAVTVSLALIAYTVEKLCYLSILICGDEFFIHLVFMPGADIVEV